MAMSLPLSNMKKNLEELVSIIIEEHISRMKLDRLFLFGFTEDKNKRLLEIREFLKEESDIAFITGIEDSNISDKFGDKITDVVSIYDTEELGMLFNCINLVLNDRNLEDTKY